MRYIGYVTGRPKSQARLRIEQPQLRSSLIQFYKVEGLRFTATKYNVTPWLLLRVLDCFGVEPLRHMTAKSHSRWTQSISLWRRNNPISIARRLVREEPVPEYYPYIQGEINEEQRLIIAVNDAVPKGIPEFQRADICQDLIVAILEHQIEVDHLKEAVPEFIKRQYKFLPLKWRPLSLDRELGEDGDGFTLKDILSDENIKQRW